MSLQNAGRIPARDDPPLALATRFSTVLLQLLCASNTAEIAELILCFPKFHHNFFREFGIVLIFVSIKGRLWH